MRHDCLEGLLLRHDRLEERSCVFSSSLTEVSSGTNLTTRAPCGEGGGRGEGQTRLGEGEADMVVWSSGATGHLPMQKTDFSTHKTRNIMNHAL